MPVEDPQEDYGMASVASDIADLERRITALRDDLLDLQIAYMSALDEDKDWSKIVDCARTAGLSKESLCRELACAWSTVTRWSAGQSAPGPFARTAIKAKLIEMVAAHRTQTRPRPAAVVSAA